MKPSKLLIESRLDTDTQGETEAAAFVMSPDEEGGIFFGGAGMAGMIAAPTATDKLKLPISIEDARQYKRAKSPAKKQAIVDKYAVRDGESSRYQFPYGGVLGSMAVSGILEIGAPAKAKEG